MLIAAIIGGIMSAMFFDETSTASLIGNFLVGALAAAIITLLVTAIPTAIFAAGLTLRRRRPCESAPTSGHRSKALVYCIAFSLALVICIVMAVVFSIGTGPQIRVELLLKNFLVFATLAVVPVIIGVNVLLRGNNTERAQGAAPLSRTPARHSDGAH